MCYEKGFVLKHWGSISEARYLMYAIHHFQGGRHGPANNCTSPPFTDNTLRAMDPVSSSIRNMVANCPQQQAECQFLALSSKKREVLTRCTDCRQLEKLFADASEGRLEEVKAGLGGLKAQSLPSPLQPLAVFAADKGRANVLQFCLDQGAIFDPDLDTAALYTDKTSEMVDIFMRANWRNIAESEAARSETGCAPGSKNPVRAPVPPLPARPTTILTLEEIGRVGNMLHW